MDNTSEIEKKIMKFWKDNKIPLKAKNLRKGKKKWYFLDGPPYATGYIHIGTAWNKILKDTYIRLMRMRGHDVWDRPGYDTHGLPIENKVEQKLGFKSKSDIENLGVKKFNQECRNYVTQFIGIMNEQFWDLGVWMNWDSPYLTLNNEYIEGAWHTFKVGFEKGFLYKDVYSVHVCPHCETSVAYNEIEYTQLNDPSIYIKFPVKGSDNEYFLIWTTTPWTLPSNTGIMAKPDADYAYVQVEGEVLIMANNLVEKVMEKVGATDYRIIRTVKGRDLEGKKYTQPLSDVFLFIDSLQNAHRVVLSDQYVTLEEGTGLVHTAPGHGQEDYKVGKETGLPIVSPLKMNGRYDQKCGRFSGMKAKEADKEIIDEFKAKGLLFHQERIAHDYPQCWRCSTPLLFMAVPQWFFKVTKIRNKLIEENKKVKWYPDWAGKRMDNWLQTLGDWPISRQRYWGIPLPIWECERCGLQKVIGSKEELPKPAPKDFHRPFIDEVLLNCKCGNKMKRIPDVLDVWFDAGLAGWASLEYPTNKETFKRFWPSDLQIEGPDQIRGWWNAELITSVITFDEKPFQRILFHGFVLDAHGNKMSKSKGNIVEPKDVVQKYGIDTLRYYLLSSPAWDDFYFNWTDAENVSKTLNILKNSFEFVKTYLTKIPSKRPILKIEDRWILSKLNSLILEYDIQFNEYNHHKVLEKLSDFILNDFSRWYIKLIRDRVWPTYTGSDKDAAYYTLFTITENLVKMLAPITPVIAEHIYQEIVKPVKKKIESVHMLDLPVADKKMINKDLEDQMELAKQMFEACSSARQEAKIKLKWPIKAMLLQTNEKRVRQTVKSLQKVLLSMCNVKKIEFVRKLPKGKFVEGTFDKYKLYLNLIEDEEIYQERLYRELTREIQEMRKKGNFIVSDEIFLTLRSDDETQKILNKYSKNLQLEVGANKIQIGELKGKHAGELNFNKKKISIAFDKETPAKKVESKK
ncbi:MAG: isoleucine--tRNA ligase [Candidatus Aenigmarchaeota archaeon]|nr:isoleucine--tRNA ligase [Candidatus Aenigmarchaeota archaeon]